MYLGIDFPRSHNLDRLVALMPVDVAERFDLEVLIELTPWAIAGRYPEDIENPAAGQARAIVDSAADIVQEVKAAARNT